MPGAPSLITTPSRQRLFTILISLASFMVTLDVSIVNVSRPVIESAYGTGITLVSWVTIAYLISLASTLIAFGHLADMRGYRTIYLSGFLVFTVTSFLCAFAPTIHILILCRFFQGIGAAMLLSIGGAMIAVYLPSGIRGWALGMLSMFGALGVAVGPAVGGFLTEALSWNWIFLINIPIGIGAILVGRRVLPGDTADMSHQKSFDGAGAGLLFVTLGSFLFAISLGRTVGYDFPLIPLAAFIFLAGAGLFLFRESRAGNPLIRLSLFRNRNYSFGNLGLFWVFFLYTGVIFLLPFYFETGCGFEPEISGMFLVIPALAQMATAVVSGWLSDRIGSRIPCIAAGLCFACTMVFFTTVSTATSLAVVIPGLVLFGVSVGFFVAPNFRLILSHATKPEAGMITGIAMTVRNTGSAIGIAVVSTVLVVVSGADSLYSTIPADDFNAGFHAVFLALSIVAFVIIALVFVSHENPEPDRA
ncbi:MAG: MFS transporter [Methanoregulaceae archaeon]